MGHDSVLSGFTVPKVLVSCCHRVFYTTLAYVFLCIQADDAEWSTAASTSSISKQKRSSLTCHCSVSGWSTFLSTWHPTLNVTGMPQMSGSMWKGKWVEKLVTESLNSSVRQLGSWSVPVILLAAKQTYFPAVSHPHKLRSLREKLSMHHSCLDSLPNCYSQ